MPENKIPDSVKRNWVLLGAFGLAVTIFGGVIVALPIEVQNVFAHMDCGNDCVSSIPSFGYSHVRALAALLAFMIVGFLPLIIFQLTKGKIKP